MGTEVNELLPKAWGINWGEAKGTELDWAHAACTGSSATAIGIGLAVIGIKSTFIKSACSTREHAINEPMRDSATACTAPHRRQPIGLN